MRARRHRAGADDRRRLAQVARPLGRRDDHRHRAVGLDVAVEEPQRVGDHARRVMVGARHRRAHHRVRVADGVLAEGDGDVGVLVVGGAVVDAVAHADHRHLLERADEPLRDVPLIQARQRRRQLLPVASALLRVLAVAGLLAARARAVDEHRVGHAGGDRRRGDARAPTRSRRRPSRCRRRSAARDCRARRAAAPRRSAPCRSARAPSIVARRDAGVVAGVRDRLDRHVVLGAAEALAERASGRCRRWRLCRGWSWSTCRCMAIVQARGAIKVRGSGCEVRGGTNARSGTVPIANCVANPGRECKDRPGLPIKPLPHVALHSVCIARSVLSQLGWSLVS